MNKHLKGVLIFLLIAIVGLVVLFLRLESVPLGFYVDEALHGYNAYSILVTGRDEYGKFLPIIFKFYGSYNAPLFVYLATLPIKIWGLNAYAVRFVSALAGFLSIVVFYFFLKNFKISLLGGLFFAITPWFVFQSRIGYEVSLAFFLFTIGLFFLWRSLEKSVYLIPSAILLSLATYAAYTERFIVPPIILLFLIIFRKKIFKKENYKKLVIAAVILFLTQIPNLSVLGTPAFFPKSDLIASAAVAGQADKLSIFPRAIALALSFVREFASQWVNYFSPRSLFLASDLDMPEIPPFYTWMLVPYLVGAIYLWKKRKEDFAKFIFLILVIAPIPAALAKDPLSTHRAMTVVLPISLIIAFGIDSISGYLDRFRHGFVIKTLVVIILFMVSVAFFWRSYFVLFTNEKAKDWSYGFEALVREIRLHPQTQYLIDDARIKLPYIELAFFMKIAPQEYQKSVDQSVKDHYYDNTPFEMYHKFENVENRSVVWEKDIYKDQIIVGDPLSISADQAKEHFFTRLFEIDDPLNQAVFIGYRTNPRKECAKIGYKNTYCESYK